VYLLALGGTAEAVPLQSEVEAVEEMDSGNWELIL
jgi:hypothetical protein